MAHWQIMSHDFYMSHNFYMSHDFYMSHACSVFSQIRPTNSPSLFTRREGSWEDQVNWDGILQKKLKNIDTPASKWTKLQHLNPLLNPFANNIYNFIYFTYPLGGNGKKGSHVYFLLIVAMVLLLWHHIVLLWHQVTMVASE